MAIIADVKWNTGDGYIRIETVAGQPNKFAISSTTSNDDIEREQDITFMTTNSKGLKASVNLHVKQLGYRELFITADNKNFAPSTNINFKVLK